MREQSSWSGLDRGAAFKSFDLGSTAMGPARTENTLHALSAIDWSLNNTVATNMDNSPKSYREGSSVFESDLGALETVYTALSSLGFQVRGAPANSNACTARFQQAQHLWAVAGVTLFAPTLDHPAQRLQPGVAFSSSLRSLRTRQRDRHGTEAVTSCSERLSLVCQPPASPARRFTRSPETQEGQSDAGEISPLAEDSSGASTMMPPSPYGSQCQPNSAMGRTAQSLSALQPSQPVANRHSVMEQHSRLTGTASTAGACRDPQQTNQAVTVALSALIEMQNQGLDLQSIQELLNCLRNMHDSGQPVVQGSLNDQLRAALVHLSNNQAATAGGPGTQAPPHAGHASQMGPNSGAGPTNGFNGAYDTMHSHVAPTNGPPIVQMERTSRSAHLDQTSHSARVELPPHMTRERSLGHHHFLPVSTPSLGGPSTMSPEPFPTPYIVGAIHGPQHAPTGSHSVAWSTHSTMSPSPYHTAMYSQATQHHSAHACYPGSGAPRSVSLGGELDDGARARARRLPARRAEAMSTSGHGGRQPRVTDDVQRQASKRSISFGRDALTAVEQGEDSSADGTGVFIPSMHRSTSGQSLQSASRAASVASARSTSSTPRRGISRTRRSNHHSNHQRAPYVAAFANAGSHRRGLGKTYTTGSKAEDCGRWVRPCPSTASTATATHSMPNLVGTDSTAAPVDPVMVQQVNAADSMAKTKMRPLRMPAGSALGPSVHHASLDPPNAADARNGSLDNTDTLPPMSPLASPTALHVASTADSVPFGPESRTSTLCTAAPRGGSGRSAGSADDSKQHFALSVSWEKSADAPAAKGRRASVAVVPGKGEHAAQAPGGKTPPKDASTNGLVQQRPGKAKKRSTAPPLPAFIGNNYVPLSVSSWTQDTATVSIFLSHPSVTPATLMVQIQQHMLVIMVMNSTGTKHVFSMRPEHAVRVQGSKAHAVPGEGIHVLLQKRSPGTTWASIGCQTQD